MASREAMIDNINRAYDARGKGDIEGLMAAFHPNAVFELKGYASGRGRGAGLFKCAGGTDWVHRYFRIYKTGHHRRNSRG